MAQQQQQPQVHQNNRNPNIEFIIKPKEDLFLEGSVRKIPRVNQGRLYYKNNSVSTF